MPVAAHTDHPRLARGQDLVHDEVGKQEVAEVVGRKVALVPVRREGVLDRHDAPVVYQDVDGGHVGPGVDLGGGLANGGQRSKVQPQNAGLDVRVGLSNDVGGLPGLGNVSARQDQKGGLGGGDSLDKVGAETAGRDAGGENDFAPDVGGQFLDQLGAGGLRAVLGRHAVGNEELILGENSVQDGGLWAREHVRNGS